MCLLIVTGAKQQFTMIVLANIGRRPRNFYVSLTSDAVMVSSINALSVPCSINVVCDFNIIHDDITAQLLETACCN